jgi:hypothetical protein
MMDKDCNVRKQYPKDAHTPIEELADALLYLGSQELLLKEQLPADIGLDSDYMREVLRRGALVGQTNLALSEYSQRVVKSSADPLFRNLQPDLQAMKQNCLDRSTSEGHVP